MSTRLPLPSTRENGVNQERNREANRANVYGEEGDRGDFKNVANSGSGIGLARSRRAQQARVKRGIRGPVQGQVNTGLRHLS